MRKLKRCFWRFVYLFRKPRTKSGLLIMLARICMPDGEVELAEVPLFDPADIRGLPVPGDWERWAEQNQDEINPLIFDELNRR